MDQAYASATAFRISPDKGIPNKSSIRSLARNRERLESLMNLPLHKTGNMKFDGDPNKRTIAPLTKEDNTNFANMGLMSTLRAGKSHSKADEQDKHHTIDNPPSFYEDDMNKWKNKFAKAVSARAQFKRTYFSQEKKTILATNDNFLAKDADAKLAEPKYTGGNI